MRTPLGQNFLTDDTIARRIVASSNLSKTDNVLEIGPGTGMLTKYLSEYAGKVLALEIDRSLASKLQKENYKNTKIIEGDILKINLPKLIGENNFQKYKVIANLPYYITSKIIRLLLETKYPPQEMILMVQKEVGERITTLDGKESLLSISVKFYAEPKLLFYVDKENFKPVPEVDSAVISIKRKRQLPKVNPPKFFSLVRAGFSAKRKTLVNNLSASFRTPKAKFSEILGKNGIEPKVRAEKLSLEDWLRLYEKLFS
jgi:16S rRNA (adenine1518-N6/adenine1519-N6)-dimethyltransferase